MKTLIKNARSYKGDIVDIEIENGIITSLCGKSGDMVIDGSGLVAIPGICDIHVHLRDPGQSHKETIETATAAAFAGGITEIVAMPNTSPVTDCTEVLEYIKAKNSKLRIHLAPAITKGLLGEEITDIEALIKAGAVAFTDDGRPTENKALLGVAAERIAKNNRFILTHSEDLKIVNGGIIHKGEVSEKLGVLGIDRESERVATAADIKAVTEAGCHIHICHVSTKEAVDVIRASKKEGLSVTCETAPHYFSLTDKLLLKIDADYRMNPPLREEADVKAIIEGLCDGTIDCIATDHAPHAPEEKKNFESAPNGIIGLETSFAASYTYLVRSGIFTLPQLIEKMTTAPRKIIGSEDIDIKEGDRADIALINLESEYTVDPEKFKSKSKNSPYKGMKLFGEVEYTVLNGEVVYRKGE